MNIEHSTVRKGVNCNQEIQGTVKASPLTERIESQDTGINPFANKSGEEIFAYNQFLNKILSHIDGCVYLPAIDGFPGFKNQKYTPSSTIKNSKTVERTDEGKPEIALKKAEARLADPGSKLSAIINKLSSEKIREILEQSFTGKSKEDLDTLARTISEGKLPLPDKVKFVSRQELKGHNAAYFYGGHREKQALTKGLINKPGTVLLADDLCGDELIAAYTEEVGHHFDHILGGDSRGDEGQIFYESIDAALKGKALDEARIGSLREEDDRGHISIDGQDMEVEHQQEQRSREELDAYIWWHEKGPYMNHEIAMRVLSGKDNTISDEAVPHIARRLSHRPEFKDLVEQFNIRHATAHKGAREFHSYLLGSGSLSKATEHLGNRHYYSPYMEREHYRAFAGTLSNLPGLDQEILGRLEHFLDGKDPITGYRRRDSRWAKPVAEREKILKAIHSHNPSALRDALEGDNSNLHQEAARYILKGAGDVPEKKTFDLLDKVNDRYGVSYANHLVAEKYLSTLPAAHEFDASAYRSYFEQKDHTGNPRYASHDARPAMDRVRLLNMMKQGNSKGFAQALGNSDENLVSRALERVKLDFTHNPAAAVNLLNELNPQQRADILADVIARTDNDDAGAIAADSLLAETDIGFKALGNRFKKSADSDEIQRQRLGALAGRREVIESALNGSIENSAFIEQSMLEGYISPSSDLARAAAGGDLTQLKSLAQTDNTVGRAAVEALGEEGEAIIDELVHRNDGIGVAAMKALAGQGKFNQIARHAEREDPAGLEAVKQLTQQGGAHLEGLVSRLSVIPAKSREVIQNALEEQLKKEKGFSLIITALPNTSKGFRSRLYDHANNTIVEKRGWQNKYGKRSGTKTPEHSFYEKVVAHALNDMGTEDLPGYSDNEADKLGRRARNLLDTAPRFDIYPGGKMENLHQALLEHQRKGNYCGEKKYGSRLDKLRHRLENYNRYRGPGFEEDLRKMGLNEDSFELLEDRITFFDEARPELYSRLKQLETRARAEGNEQALKRLDQIFEALAEKESCNTPYRNKIATDALISSVSRMHSSVSRKRVISKILKD